MPDLPLVTCIMPTFNRRKFVPAAIEYYLRQDYANRELIVLDDGSDPVQDLIPDDTSIRYVRLEGRRSTGAKRNAACRLAQGAIIAHWDDDDWHARWRLGYQVSALLDSDAQVCGASRLIFHEPASGRSWEYVYPDGARPWLAGGTLCYHRSFWERNPFDNVRVGEDTRFVWKCAPGELLALERNSFYVALIHKGNSSRKNPRSARWSSWSGDIGELTGSDLGSSGKPSNNHQHSKPTTMKLNLGCCDALLDGYTNVDLIAAPGVQVADLSQPWPWEESTIDTVRAWDIIEHLPDKIQTMNELWRVLKPGGRAEIAVPTTDGTGAFQDPTHVSFWNRRSFLYYEAGNPYRERFANHYGIRASFRTCSERVDRSADGPRLTIVLEAVKS
jgi:hypothetical protein